VRTVAYRKKFVPPSKDQVVAVRHQHYQGEDHPSSRRISIRVPVSALPLKSPEALHKFKLLAGARWHPPLPDTLKHPRDKVGWKVAEGDKDEGLFELSCDVFPYDRMNEKWCSDTLDKLLKEANVRRRSLLLASVTLIPPTPRLQDLKKETFADIPIDTRYRRQRLLNNRKLRKNVSIANYPKEWLPVQAQEASAPIAAPEKAQA
jgi:small subunit ribosomal protein S35